LDLPRFFVKAFSEEEDVWVDPFMGSGSTILACWEEGRIGLGIEVVPELASIAITRLAKEMDTEPEKIVEKVV
jgi:DNA modification methylase